MRCPINPQHRHIDRGRAMDRRRVYRCGVCGHEWTAGHKGRRLFSAQRPGNQFADTGAARGANRLDPPDFNHTPEHGYAWLRGEAERFRGMRRPVPKVLAQALQRPDYNLWLAEQRKNEARSKRLRAQRRRS